MFRALIQAKDFQFFFLTYFLNFLNFQGPDSSQAGELDYNKQGDSYRELVTLLKDKSQKFAEMIDKQSFSLKVKEKDDLLIQTKKEKTRDDGETDYQRQTQDNRARETTQDMGGKQKSKVTKKKKLEPSLKWRALGMEEYQER